MTTQDEVFVRVKTEIDALSTGSERSANVGGQSYRSHIKQQIVNRDEPIQGNEEFTCDEENSDIIVKQEPMDETCSSSYETVPLSSEKIFHSRDKSMYEFSVQTSQRYVKRMDHSDLDSGLENTTFPSDPVNPTCPEKIRISPVSSRERESHLFPWPSENEMRRLHFEAGKSGLTMRRVQSPSTIDLQPLVTERMMDEVVSRKRQHKNTKRSCPDFENASGERRQASPIAMNEDNCSSSRLQRSLLPGRIEQNGSSSKDGSTQTKEKGNTSYFSRQDEEPVWKTYQWYRDRKRPYTQQNKRRKAEPTIFMQYNEIRDRRCLEGRVVDNRRRFSEPSKALGNSSKDGCTFSSFCNIPPSIESASNDTNEYPDSLTLTPTSSESSPAKHKKQSDNPTLLHGENPYWRFSGRADFERRNHASRHFSFIRGHVQCIEGDNNSDSEACKETPCKAYCDKVEPRNGVATPINDDDTCREYNDEGLSEISSTTYQNDVRVLPETFRHCPQDVAKILRLSRIVNNVRNNRDGRLPGSTRKEHHSSETIKQWEVSSTHNRFGDGMQGRLLLLERHDKHSKAHSSDSLQDVERAFEDEKNAMENVLSTPDRNPHKGRMKRFEGRPDYSCFNDSDQESFADGQTVLDDDDTVCQVNGLLSLPGFKETKYNISLGELKRRMNPPETLTRVEMISYLRQAKSSGRFLLDRYNIVTANRSHPTILSRLCEGEAQTLADGILKMNREYLPLATLARKTVEGYKDDKCKVVNCEDCRLKLRRRIVDVEITRNSLKELLKVVEETKKEDGFQTFEHASHNFGLPNLHNHISLLDDYFKLLLLTLQDE